MFNGRRASRYHYNNHHVHGGPGTTRNNYRRNNRASQGSMHWSSSSWYRVTISGVHCNDRDTIAAALNDNVTTHVNLYQFGVEMKLGRISFFLNSRDEYFAVRDIGNTIMIKGRPCAMHIHRSDEPAYLFDENSVCYVKEYVKDRQTRLATEGLIDLSNFHKCDFLKSKGIYLNMSRYNCANKILNYAIDISKDLVVNGLDLSGNEMSSLEVMGNKFKQVKQLNLSNNKIHRMKELEFLKHMKLTELMLEENPICSQFRDRTLFVSAIRENQPRLVILDNESLPPIIGFEVDQVADPLPESRDFYVPETVHGTVTSFLQLYFELFDSSKRQSLINAYTEDAKLSVAVSGQKLASFETYIVDGRNFNKIPDEGCRYDRMKLGRCDIVAFFVRFPPTVHDLSSFKVDVYYDANPFYGVSVQGAFKEVDRHTSHMRSFCRMFICNVSEKGMAVLDEHWQIRDATVSQVVALKDVLPPKLDSVTQDNKKEQMIAEIMRTTGMRREFSLQCLEGNQWDLGKALTNFAELKEQNMIPAHAFTG